MHDAHTHYDLHQLHGALIVCRRLVRPDPGGGQVPRFSKGYSTAYARFHGSCLEASHGLFPPRATTDLPWFEQQIPSTPPAPSAEYSRAFSRGFPSRILHSRLRPPPESTGE